MFKSLTFFAFFFALPSFAVNGSDGSNGVAGRDGLSGENKVIYADGKFLTLDLRGTDGTRGSDGQPGQFPACLAHGFGVGATVHQPSGGDGGKGGRGGHGGDGGDVTIYYSHIENLKSIQINARPGLGAAGGRGAYGAPGCKCTQSSWREEVCTNVRQQDGSVQRQCADRTYYCYNGSKGYQGGDGSRGRDGSLGSVTLIKQKNALEPVHPSKTVSLTEATEAPVEVSAYRWKYYKGATQLFGNGSVLSDNYREFDGIIRSEYQILWRAPEDSMDFENTRFRVYLDDETAKLRIPDGVWLKGRESNLEGIRVYEVERALKQKDAVRLDLGSLEGTGKDAKLIINDIAGMSELVKTGIYLHYSHRRFIVYSEIWEGEVPPQLIDIKPDSIVINVGQLPIDEKYFERPNKLEPRLVKFKLKVSRELQSQSATVDLEGKYKIR